MPASRGLVVGVGLLAVVAGCVVGSNTFQVNAHKGGNVPHTDTEEQTWTNHGAAARVVWTKSGAGGVALAVMDAAGTKVFERSLSGSGEAASGAGQAGSWTIQVRYQRFLGDLKITLVEVR